MRIRHIGTYKTQLSLFQIILITSNKKVHIFISIFPEFRYIWEFFLANLIKSIFYFSILKSKSLYSKKFANNYRYASNNMSWRGTSLSWINELPKVQVKKRRRRRREEYRKQKVMRNLKEGENRSCHIFVERTRVLCQIAETTRARWVDIVASFFFRWTRPKKKKCSSKRKAFCSSFKYSL